MGRCRPCDKLPCKNVSFIGVIIALVLVYILFSYQYLFRQNNVGIIFALVTLTHLMSLWSFFTAALTNPGPVPVFWGIYSEKVQGERKYCLKCHNFKPQRAHHCSTCQQCVLNMDHHCPWINNCVGFDNRKYFLLFLTYLLVALYISIVVMILVLIKDIGLMTSGHSISIFDFVLKIILFFFFAMLICTLTYFTISHYKFVIMNTTTLDQLILGKKRKDVDYHLDSDEDSNQYNINCYYNFTQVFGENPFYWFVPVQEEKPLRGRGVVWDKNNYEGHSLKEQKTKGSYN